LRKQYEELKKENETLKQYQASVLKERRNSFVSRYDKIKDAVNFDKISKDLKVPEQKDGKLDWDSLTDDDISANLEIIIKAEEWGLFEKQPGGNPPNRQAAGNDKIKDPFDDFPGKT
jgi:chromosome segregation ATPase